MAVSLLATALAPDGRGCPYIFVTSFAHRIWLERKSMENVANTNMPNRPDRSRTDERINPTPDSEERAEQVADKLAHKGAEREQEYDDQQKPFTK
jgi:hypothetical protein